MSIARLNNFALQLATPFKNFIVLVGVKSFGKPAYGIIILTFLTRLAFLPVSLAAARTSKRLKTLKPAIQEINEKFQREPGQHLLVKQAHQQQKEIMELYRRESVKPAMGCLPLLWEAFALSLLELGVKASKDDERFSDGGILWFKDLNKPDRYFILPISLMLMEYITHRMKTPPEGFETQIERRVNNIGLPIIVVQGVVMSRRPAGEALYSVVSSACSIVQQYLKTGWGSLFKMRF